MNDGVGERRGKGRGLPALFRMSEKSFNVALLGSTPNESVKSFVARSMLNVSRFLMELLCFGYVGELCCGN